MPHWLLHFDRRWIFLAMLVGVATPLLLGLQFPEVPSPKTIAVFDAIENLPDGSTVLLSLDFDPSSSGELEPMASAITRHCCEKKHRILYLTLWDRGVPMIQDSLDIIEREYPQRAYGKDYVNLGYKSGGIVVIKNAVTNLRADFSRDQTGKSLDQLAITRDLKSLRDLGLLISVGAGYPGPREWVQYAAAQYNLKMVAGATGVQAPQLSPYLPEPLLGVLGAIKGAAEYEKLLLARYPHLEKNPATVEGQRRMGPQFVAHLLIVALIVAGNAASFWERWSARR